MRFSRRVTDARQRAYRGAIFVVATASAAMIASIGLAAPAPETPQIAAWRVECTGDGKTIECRAIQQVFQRETRQLVASVVVRHAPDPKAGLVTIQLPLGLNLTEPIQIRVDNGPPERQPIQTCANVGCFVVFTASDKLITAMRSGTDLKLAMQDASRKTLEVSLPLLGFGLAFDKAK